VSNALGIWPVRAEAERLAERLAHRLGAELFRPWEREELQKAQFQAQFVRHSHWVLIMATGIATRFVEGLLRDKHHDPAVVVLDEAGRYAISLLGGHEAGANSLAYRVANAVGAVPVVTTATEAIKPFVVGVGCRKGVGEEHIAGAIRQALALCGRQTRGGNAFEGAQSSLGPMGMPGQGALTQPAGLGGLMGSGGPAGLTGSGELAGLTGSAGPAGLTGSGGPAGLTESGELAGLMGSAGLAGLTGSAGPTGLTGSAGLAAPADRSCSVKAPALGTVGAAAEFSCVRELVTVDLKAHEPGLLAFSQRYGIPLRVIARHQIEARSWVTRPSEWVRQSVGLDGVCEPCALIACGRGRLVVPKTTLDGVAVAVVEDDWGSAA
jgi:cobalamin biosynthesis protein CbiG